jgi:hypothetical protein
MYDREGVAREGVVRQLAQFAFCILKPENYLVLI